MILKKSISIVISVLFLVFGCVSQKKHTTLQAEKQLSDNKIGLLGKDISKCEKDLSVANTRIQALEEQLNYLKNSNEKLINNVGNMTTLSTKGAENLEKSLETIKEKDTRIKTLQDALTRKDSITIALVTSIKSALGNADDTDIEVNVDKGVVFVSIADKMLFQSGSYKVSDKAKTILNKVAIIAKSKPDFELMVESHTDDVPVRNKEFMIDNWDLSVLRSTSIVRLLQTEMNISPDRIIAAGRSQFNPLVSNDSPAGKSRNRRTRIILLPKIDQFYKMVEDGMKESGKK
ncbi:MAG: hypothetical protein EAZ27_13580 [Cytophagales bacterium]|nr:MAG: hypothetical protein EAZ27_13580 [Cytophagales bacterium]